MYNVSYGAVERELVEVNAAVSVAEGHGCLCGALCTLDEFSAANWLQELLPDISQSSDNDRSESSGTIAVNGGLQQLFADTSRALRSDEMEFAPLLPDDEQPLAQRIAALAQWSHGFLYGFGIGAPGQTKSGQTKSGQAEWSEDVTEVLRDLAEIARADDATVGNTDQEEEAYTELVEYLRAAVQLLHDELAAQRRTQSTERSATRPQSH